MFGLRGLAIAVTGSVALALSVAGASGAASEPAPGVTPSSVKIGFITSKTGPAASTSGNSDLGCKARVGRAERGGGCGRPKGRRRVHGRPDIFEPGAGTVAGPERARLRGHQ